MLVYNPDSAKKIFRTIVILFIDSLEYNVSVCTCILLLSFHLQAELKMFLLQKILIVAEH